MSATGAITPTRVPLSTPRLNRWYFHAENSHQFSTSGEILGSCPAAWSATAP